MARQTDYERIILISLRATARFLGSILFLMIIMSAIGKDIPNPFSLTLNEAISFFSFVVMLTGLIVAWRLEGIGGLVVLFGYLVFIIVNPFSLSVGVIAIFPLTGALFVIFWRVDEKRKQRGKT